MTSGIRKHATSLACALALGLIPVSSLAQPAPPKLFVDDSSPAAIPNGSSWALAYRTVQEAIDHADSQNLTGAEILVAEGTYYPTTELYVPPGTFSSARNRVIRLKENVRLRGGFLGWNNGSPGGVDPGAPDGSFNLTVLSGDTGAPQDAPDNVHHVLVVMQLDQTNFDSVVIDGFRVIGGYADGSLEQGNGAALFVPDGVPVRIENVVFRGNYAEGQGGAIWATGAMEIAFCTFRENNAAEGGALYAYLADVEIGNSTFRDNGKYRFCTGGLCSYTAPPVKGGAIFIENEARVVASNVRLFDNVAEEGAAVYVNPPPCTTGMYQNYWRHCTFAFNVATESSPGATYYSSGVNPPTPEGYCTADIEQHFYNSIIWDTVSQTDVWVGANTKAFLGHSSWDWSPVGPGTYSIFGPFVTGDPLFKDPTKRDLRLSVGSQCLDSGLASLRGDDIIDVDGDGNAGELLPLDFDLLARILGSAPDMGAHETPFGQP